MKVVPCNQQGSYTGVDKISTGFVPLSVFGGQIPFTLSAHEGIEALSKHPSRQFTMPSIKIAQASSYRFALSSIQKFI